MNILDIITKETGNVYMRKAATHGGEYSGPCPFCSDHGTDRMSIHPAKNHYVCRRCRKAGDSIQFVKEFLNKSYIEACQYLDIQPKLSFNSLDTAKDSGDANDIRWTPREIVLPSELWQEKAEAFLFQKFKYLMSPAGLKQRKWLNNRGLSNETIKKVRLGLNESPVNFDLETWGVTPEKGQSTFKTSLWVPKGIIIPLFENNKLIRLRIRQMDITAKSRFIIVKGSSSGFFNYSKHLSVDMVKNKPWIVTESELDGWLLQQECQNSCHVFAIGNSSARSDTETHNYLKNNPGLINLDNDIAGQNEMAWWTKHYPDAIPYYSKTGKDPGEDFQAGTNISQWIQDGLSLLNIQNNGDKKEQLKTSNDFKKKIIDNYNNKLNNYKDFKKETFDNYNNDLKEITHKTKGQSQNQDTKSQSQAQNLKSQPQVKICVHNEYCVSLKNNVCLINKTKPFETMQCPGEKWYTHKQGAVTQVIYGMAYKK